jgi:hypothetical protein
MPFFTTHLVRPYLQDSPLFTRSNQTHPVCSSSDLLHSSAIPRSHARARQSGLIRRTPMRRGTNAALSSPFSSFTLSPSIRPSASPRSAFRFFCRYPLPSVRLRITPLFQSFAGIPFVQFVPSLSFHSLCLLPLSPPFSSRHTSPAAVFGPFVAIPSGQVTLYLAYRFWPPLLPLSH